MSNLIIYVCPCISLSNCCDISLIFIHVLVDKPYKCDICDMHFTIPWNRDRHQNADHIFLTSGDDIYVRQAGMKKITIRKWSPSDKLGKNKSNDMPQYFACI